MDATIIGSILESLAMIKTQHLFEISLTVPEIVDVGRTPLGARKIATVTGGRFEGDRIKGEVMPSPGGDWLLLRADNVLTLDVRLTLKTDDNALIYMHYKGLRHGPDEVMARLAKGEAVDPDSYYFRMAPVFETGSEKYAWINRMLCVATGHRLSTGPVYQVYEVL
jgi:hypothetical protein